jgi:hypothetical protein
MPRASGPHNERDSTVVAVRVPNEMLQAAVASCGGDRSGLSAWLRNVIRYACQTPIDYGAGYDEGYRAGWNAANTKFKAALRKAG